MLSSPYTRPHVVAPTGRDQAEGPTQGQAAGSTAQGGTGQQRSPRPSLTPLKRLSLSSLGNAHAVGRREQRPPWGMAAPATEQAGRAGVAPSRSRHPGREPQGARSSERGHGREQHPGHHPSLRPRADAGPVGRAEIQTGNPNRVSLGSSRGAGGDALRRPWGRVCLCLLQLPEAPRAPHIPSPIFRGSDGGWSLCRLPPMRTLWG